MNQKGIAPLIIVAIVVVAAVAVVGVVLVATRGGGGAGGGGGGCGGGGEGGAGTATSLQFTVDVTTGEEISTMIFKAKDIGSNNMKIRVEGTMAGQEIIYIIN